MVCIHRCPKFQGSNRDSTAVIMCLICGELLCSNCYRCMVTMEDGSEAIGNFTNHVREWVYHFISGNHKVLLSVCNVLAIIGYYCRFITVMSALYLQYCILYSCFNCFNEFTKHFYVPPSYFMMNIISSIATFYHPTCTISTVIALVIIPPKF